MADIPNNAHDIIDSRNVIARLEEMQQELLDLDGENFDDAITAWRVENGAELAALEALNDEGESYAEDWKHGATLIRHDYFVKYAEELAYDLGILNESARWPHNHIDWEAASEELKIDYTTIDFDGVDYYVR